MTLEDYKKIKENIVIEYINKFDEKINILSLETDKELDKINKKEDDIIDE